MAFYAVTAVEMSPGGTGHDHITRLYGAEWNGTVEQVIGCIHNGDHFYVDGPYGRAYLYIVDAYPRPYVRTHANGTPTDNLLSLPRYRSRWSA